MIRYLDKILGKGKKQKGKRVLIVDDDSNLRAALEGLLEIKGYEIIQASDGEEGLEKVKTTHPDIIILDAMMPGKGGIEAASELKDNPDYSSIPIIMLTAIDKISGKSEEYWREKSRADLYIAKPFDYVKFVSTVEKMLEEPGLTKP